MVCDDPQLNCLATKGEEEEDVQSSERPQYVEEAGPSHHPSAPPHELFDISTTVDPSYVISLIRKLIPSTVKSCGHSDGVDAMDHYGSDGLDTDKKQLLNDESENMDVVDDSNESACERQEDEGSSSHREQLVGQSAVEEVWEESGCILWDLAASKSHAELMVENLILEVLMANLMVSESVRVKEICLGIIGNLACHEVPMRHIISTNGLVEIIIDQLFLDDTQCLCETFRLLILGFQVGERKIWAEVMRSEHILSRILWIAENTLNAQILEKSVGLLLAILENPEEVSSILLPTLLKLGLANLMISLLTFEMGNLSGERPSDRYTVIDVILRVIEALSTMDCYSWEISSNDRLLQLVCELVKFPEKAEVANSCVTAAVLIANILSDVPDLAADMSKDLPFLEGLLEILPFASDDIDAQKALFSILARLLARVKEHDMSTSILKQYVLILANKCDLIEDDLLDKHLGYCNQEATSLTESGTKIDIRSSVVQRIIGILNQWNASVDFSQEGDLMANGGSYSENIKRLLDCCYKYLEI